MTNQSSKLVDGSQERAEGPETSLDETRERVGHKAQKVLAKPGKLQETKILRDYLKELEDSKKDPEISRRLQKLKLVLIFIGKFVDVETDKIRLRKLPGMQIGEAHTEAGFVEIDPVLLNEDDLATLRHALVHEYLVHLKKGVDNEGLTELETTRVVGDQVRDYENLVSNVQQVTNALGKGDKEKGILTAVELYSDGRYDELFAKYEAACDGRPDALQVFQLAFPELKLTNEGEFGLDEETVAKEWKAVNEETS